MNTHNDMLYIRFKTKSCKFELGYFYILKEKRSKFNVVKVAYQRQKCLGHAAYLNGSGSFCICKY